MKRQVYVPTFFLSHLLWQHSHFHSMSSFVVPFAVCGWAFLESWHRIVCFCLICLLSFWDLPSTSFKANCDVTSARIVNHQKSQFEKWKPRLLSGNPGCWIIGALSSILYLTQLEFYTLLTFCISFHHVRCLLFWQVVERKPRCRSIAIFSGFEPSRDVCASKSCDVVIQCWS